MEGFGFGKSKKTVKGVSKKKDGKNRFVLFFELFFRKFWKMVGLNVLYVICCIPIVTIGPATAAFTKLLKYYMQERHVDMIRDFFGAFKSNFKQSFVVGIMDIALVVLFSVTLQYYWQQSVESTAMMVGFSLAMCTAIIIFLMHFYIYLMMVSTKLKLGDILKNSLILAISQMKTNIQIILFSLIIIIPMALFWQYIIPIIPFLPLSILGFIVCFIAYPVIRKIVIQPYYDQRGELNPEFEYSAQNDKDVIFRDDV